MVQFFSGHLIPGTLYFMLALRWMIATSYNYVKSKQTSTDREVTKGPVYVYRTSVTMRLPCNLFYMQHNLVETYLKLIGGLYGVVSHVFQADAELYRAKQGIVEENGDFGDTWSIVYRTKHHYAIYAMFVLSALVELMVYYGIELPEKLDRAFLIMSFVVEGFIFSFHFHGRSNIDVQLHILQTCSIGGCVLFCILEAIDECQVLFAFGRILFTALQGSWFFETAFVLYYPFSWPKLRWDLHDQKLAANVTFHFCMHLMVILVILLIVHWFIQRTLVLGYCCFDKKKNKMFEMSREVVIKRKEDFVVGVNDFKVNQWSTGDNVFVEYDKNLTDIYLD
jgi:hypothetical protein